MRPGEKAWLGLGAGVVAWDILCPPGETLSETVDSALERPFTRILAVGGIALTATHLLNMLPRRLDPIHQAVRLARGITNGEDSMERSITRRPTGTDVG